MNCDQTKESLGARFDDGVPLNADVAAHLEGCADCQRYAARLAALDDALSDIAPDEPTPELIGLVQRTPEIARRRKNRQIIGIGTGVAAVVGAVIAAGIWFPGIGSPAGWWDFVARYLPESGWTLPRESIFGQFVEMYHAMPDNWNVLGAPAYAVWIGLMLALFGWVGFNIYCATRLRTAGENGV